jgi:hypothetical protein
MRPGTLTLAIIVFYVSFGFLIFLEKALIKITSIINNERSTIE